jgi:succinoglycan biosynthesis transport protein ExoP
MSEDLMVLRNSNAPAPFVLPERVELEPFFYGSLRVLRRHKLMAVVVFVLFALPAAVFVKRRPPVYQATARVLIERNDEVASVMKDPTSGAPALDGLFQTQLRLLSSRPIVVKAIQTIKLWESPQFKPDSARPVSGTADDITRTGLVERFLAHLSVVPVAGTHLVNITFEASDPVLAMNAANVLVQTYVDEQMASQVADSSNVKGWINDRLAEQQRHLADSEAALQTYMETHDAVSVQERQNIVVQKLSDLNTALTRAKTERMAKEVQFHQLERAGTDATALDSLPIVLSNPELQALRTQLAELKQKELGVSQDLGERHPDLFKLRSEIDLTTKRLAAALATLVESVSNDYHAAQAIEEDLLRALEQQKKEVLALNQKGLDYGALQREAVSSRQIYERLLNESRTRDVTSKTVQSTFRIVESAEQPLAPIGPQNTRDLGMVLMAGLLLAVSVPLTLESIDQRIKTPSDIEQRLRQPCISIVPEVRGKSVPMLANRPLMTQDANVFNEAFRRLRVAICMRTSHEAALRVLVTSAVPGEGKSLVAANLAIAFARAGQRVLLVDADLRRPTVHTHFGLDAAPGFTNILRRDAEGRGALRATAIPNLFVLPSGSNCSDAAELLSSPMLQAALTVFENSFNLIVFDSPPVGPVADACVFARRSQYTFLVVAAGSTKLAAASAAIDQLTAAGATIGGVILNRADLERSAYYYGPYHQTQSVYYGGTTIDAESAAKLG